MTLERGEADAGGARRHEVPLDLPPVIDRHPGNAIAPRNGRPAAFYFYDLYFYDLLLAALPEHLSNYVPRPRAYVSACFGGDQSLGLGRAGLSGAAVILLRLLLARRITPRRYRLRPAI